MSESQLQILELLRHSKTYSNMNHRYNNWESEPLSPNGRRDVLKFRESHYKDNPDLVITSPYLRCVETATCLLGETSVPRRMDDNLREMNLGPWNGLTECEIAERFPKEWSTWNRSPHCLNLPGRESLSEVQRRLENWLSVVRNTEAVSHILVVTHAVVIRVLIARFLDVKLSNARALKVPNLKMFRVCFDGACSEVCEVRSNTCRPVSKNAFSYD